MSFTLSEDIDVVISILKSRLPDSANVYNIAILCKNSRLPTTSFYTLDFIGNISLDSWVVALGPIYKQQDSYGVRCSISAPQNVIITEETFEAFAKTNIFDWTRRYMFCALQSTVSDFVSKILSLHGARDCKIKVTTLQFYVMLPHEALALNSNHSKFEGAGIELKPLDVNKGAKFLTDTWKYSTPRTHEYMKEFLATTESMGVYINGNPISGMICTEQGLIGRLFTLEEHRGKGFGALVMTTLMKNLATLGAVPISGVYPENTLSLKFHEKIGMGFSRMGDNIDYVPPEESLDKS